MVFIKSFQTFSFLLKDVGSPQRSSHFDLSSSWIIEHLSIKILVLDSKKTNGEFFNFQSSPLFMILFNDCQVTS